MIIISGPKNFDCSGIKREIIGQKGKMVLHWHVNNGEDVYMTQEGDN